MASPLEDLDELVLRCRDEKARLYISEAVASYKAGAFRASIVATWIAVCFDVIEKLRELALAGDKQAEKQIQDLDAIRRTNDLQGALKFERELLDKARDAYELISPLEYIDLERLQSDRNRCAHPSLTSDDQAYSPSGELARLHIHSAVTHVLQHPPVQGKYALDRLMREIESEYFPTSVNNAKVVLGSGPLRRPRASLVRNLVLILAKALLIEEPNIKRALRVGAALGAIRELHGEQYARPLGERLSPMVRALEDDKLPGTLTCMRRLPGFWDFMDPDVRQRLENYVTKLPVAVLEEVEFLLEYPPLKEQAKQRVARASKKELVDTVFFESPREVVDRYITIYFACASFDEANEWAKHMGRELGDFQPDHVRYLLANASKHSQVRGSFGLETVIAGLRARKHIPYEEFDELLREHDLDEFVPSDEE